jgi:hypothetical protein
MSSDDVDKNVVYCSNCKFADKRLNKPSYVICRKYAPKPFFAKREDDVKKSISQFAKFPLVDVDAWCGEFEFNSDLEAGELFTPEIEDEDLSSED